MNIREALLAKRSKALTMRIVRYIGDDRERFAELMNAFFSEPCRATQWSAWPMSYCVQRHPELIVPYLKKLLDHTERDDVQDVVRRNVMRLLQYVEIPERLQGRVYSLCLDLIGDLKQPVAIKAFAVTTARRIADSEPSLMNELALVVKEQLPHNSIAFAKRAREVL